MIYNLPYQTEELLKSSYFKLRNNINPNSDTLHLTIAHSQLQDMSYDYIYKKVLKLEGMYRTENNLWTADSVKVRIINQL